MNHKSKLDHWCEAVIEAGWLAALVVAPLFFNVFSSRVFEPDKISLIRSIALIMLLAWLVKVANGGPLWLPAALALGGNAEPEGEAAKPFWRRWVQVPFLLPIALLVVAYLLSTLFSVAPYVSWWGSYQRLQGTYTYYSYIVIALLTMAHLRQAVQIRRIQHAIIVTSLPIAIYGVVQHYGIDPLPWGGDVTTRVAANAGNAIFLSAYLIMAFFFTLERIYSSFAHLLGYKPNRVAEAEDMATALAGGAYLFILLVQLLAIFWTQSRGPLLGLLLGIYVFGLLLFTGLRPRYYRGLTLGWVGLGVAGALFLVLLNTTTLFNAVHAVPSLRRLSTILDLESVTAQVRLLIWEGAARMVAPHEPLVYPDGHADPVNVLRPLVGYGPEAMWIAYNPFYPPELAHVEARNASPDRSHNETWDSLVITGILGFLAYMSLFISIFYWALRWLGLLVNRRDTWLFGGLLLACGAGAVIFFYVFDQSWRFFGVALPAGLMLGLGIYVTVAAYLHPQVGSEGQRDVARQLLIITLLATIVAHFVEIHFGIAIAATRTYFWIQLALLLVLGMNWAQTGAMAWQPQPETEEAEAEPEPAQDVRGRRRRRRPARPRVATRREDALPALPGTVMVDLLIFLTFVFIYTTNAQGSTNPFGILFSSVLQRNEGGAMVSSPAIFFLMLFTWLVAATLGLAAEALQRRRVPGMGWWIQGYLLHAGVIWGGWLIYGGIQGARLAPGAAGTDLDSQLNMVAGHFALYTWLLVAWMLVAGGVYAWPWLRDARVPTAGRAAVSLAAGTVLAVVILAIISSVNIALVKADIIYKQGQQFDQQGNWLSSIELYRRALAVRKTEDHYMLFLGRSLLEQAKRAPVEGSVQLPPQPRLEDVLSLTPQMVSQMSQGELLRAAEVVLIQAQRVNPLNTDHTANLARLYRTWADLATDPAVRQEMLDRSIAHYDMAVRLSPNAAHLWNEKGNAHQARGEEELAEQAYLRSLSLDQKYDQTYLLLADFYDRRQAYDEAVRLLRQGIEQLPRNAQLYSYLGVMLARQGDLQGAIDANLKVLELQPFNAGAMRNLALLYRDLGETDEAIRWVNQAITATNPNSTAELVQLHQLAAQLYQAANQNDQVIVHYEQIRALQPDDVATLNTLYSLYAAESNWNKAVEVLQALAALEPDNYRHPLAIAQILNQVGQTENALAFANQALSLAPEDQKASISAFIQALSAGS